MVPVRIVVGKMPMRGLREARAELQQLKAEAIDKLGPRNPWTCTSVMDLSAKGRGRRRRGEQDGSSIVCDGAARRNKDEGWH